MSRARVINLIGGPGCGKSTTAADLYSLMKKSGQSVELVTEVAKDYVWDESYKLLRDQIFIFGQQYHNQWRLRDRVDWVITDSPLLLNLYYSSDRSETFFKLIVEKFYDFDNLVYFIDRGVSEFSQEGRVHTYEQSIKADSDIKELLTSYGIPFEIVDQNSAAREIFNFVSKYNFAKE